MPKLESPDDYDSPWKEILEARFEDFMALFFPRAHAQIDWSRGWQSLDHELQQITPDAELGRRLADKLMKVFLQGGEEEWVLIHNEIQNQQVRAFAERVFTCNYRAWDRHHRPVVSLAVLGDDSPRWRPSRFGYGLWGSRMQLRFPVVKLRDYNARWPELQASANPFATVVMVHLQTRATHGDPQSRLHWKTRLVRGLYHRGWGWREVIDLFRFIDWMMALPEELALQFHVDHVRFEEEQKMRYVTTAERIGMEKGFKEGLEVGTEQGLQQGISRGETLLLERLLSRRFSALPSWVQERLRGASREQLESWSDRVLDAGSLEEVFSH